MKKIIMTAAMLGLTATGALAQTATQDVNITATVPKFCTIGGITNPAALNSTVPVSATGVVTTTQISHTVANATCNTAADVVATSQSGGIKSATAAASGFTNIINYTGAATFGPATSTINTATNPAATAAEAGNTGDTLGAVTGNLTITIDPVQPGSPLMAATDYADVLRVTLTAR